MKLCLESDRLKAAVLAHRKFGLTEEPIFAGLERRYKVREWVVGGCRALDCVSLPLLLHGKQGIADSMQELNDRRAVLSAQAGCFRCCGLQGPLLLTCRSCLRI